MQSDDYKKFAIFIAMLGTAFGEKGIIPAKIELYWEYLKDISIEDIQRATGLLIKTRKYSSIPTIAEIREAALGRDEDIETAAVEAWGCALYAVGRGKFPTGNPLIEEAVKTAFGGWEEFGRGDTDQNMADRAHFLRVFKGLAKARRERGLPALPAVKPAEKLPEHKGARS